MVSVAPNPFLKEKSHFAKHLKNRNTKPKIILRSQPLSCNNSVFIKTLIEFTLLKSCLVGELRS